MEAAKLRELEESVRGKPLTELLQSNIYCQVQEQGQERTWIEQIENLEKDNKHCKDEIFVGHLPVSNFYARACTNLLLT